MSTSREAIIVYFIGQAKKEISGTRRSSKEGLQDATILIYSWIAFEAFTCLKYNKDGVGQRITAFCDNFNTKYSQNYGKLPTEYLECLEKLSKIPIRDMRPNCINNRPKQIEDKNNLNNIFEVIYQIRNNLFHGGKDTQNDRDVLILYLGSRILYYILEKFLREEGYTF